MAVDRYVIPVTIASGTSLSAAVNVNANEIVGVMMPASWTAASITLAALVADGTTFGKVQSEGGTEVALTSPDAGLYIHLATPLRGLGQVKVRSGTAAAAVNQAGDRTLKLVLVRTG